MEIDYTNKVLMNYYRKQEILKAKDRLAQRITKAEILKLADNKFVTAEEIKEALGFDFIEDPEPSSNTENIITNEEITELASQTKGEKNIIRLIEDSILEDYPNQPFKLYNEDKKKEMIESIKNFGIMQPLIVRPINNRKYQILAGHNRRRCARELGTKKYPCIIKEKITVIF